MDTSYFAVMKSARISPRKVRLVADLIRGKLVGDAIELLRFTHKKAAPLVSKVIQSALANAEDKATVDVDRLIVSEAFVDGGATLKRFCPRAQGRAGAIRKRTSHITVKLKEI